MVYNKGQLVDGCPQDVYVKGQSKTPQQFIHLMSAFRDCNVGTTQVIRVSKSLTVIIMYNRRKSNYEKPLSLVEKLAILIKANNNCNGLIPILMILVISVES